VDPGDYVRITVADTGSGMDRETITRVFEPFFSARDEEDHFDPGRGLGLSATYGIVKQMGGYIWVESEKGEGTVFSLLFPYEPASPAAAGAEVEEGVDPRGTETVLLVEDDPQVLRLLEKALSLRGYDVLPARNGPEAVGIARLADGQFDVLVTDVVMPSMRGTELARLLRREDAELPVLFVTGYADDAELRTGLLGERDELLRKPFRTRELSVALRRLLDRAGGDGPRSE
jgi:CheY-like chemotaxis protein